MRMGAFNTAGKSPIDGYVLLVFGEILLISIARITATIFVASNYKIYGLRLLVVVVVILFRLGRSGSLQVVVVSTRMKYGSVSSGAG